MLRFCPFLVFLCIFMHFHEVCSVYRIGFVTHSSCLDVLLFLFFFCTSMCVWEIWSSSMGINKTLFWLFWADKSENVQHIFFVNGRIQNLWLFFHVVILWIICSHENRSIMRFSFHSATFEKGEIINDIYRNRSSFHRMGDHYQKFELSEQSNRLTINFININNILLVRVPLHNFFLFAQMTQFIEH